jgi:hypothetical protein
MRGSRPPIEPGMVYEDCAFHPVFCTHVHSDDSVSGISLLDGSAPRTCDLFHCGVIPLSIATVLEIRRDFPAYIARRKAELEL